MDFDETEFEIYSEWAENELIWGKGMFNWRRLPKEEKPMNYEICEHPFCTFGG